MSGSEPLFLTIAMFAVIALGWGGGYMIVRRGERMRGALMIVAALVLFGNVLVWAWPIGPQPPAPFSRMSR